jgi:DNA polymerase I-like protein with 3'-5' exonuclease and polymerase domains
MAKNYALDKLFPKNRILKKYHNNGAVTTPFKRVIESDEYHALNYLIQSTTSDFFLRKLIQLNKSISDLDTFVAFCIHDSVVLDFKEEDKDKLLDIIKAFGSSSLGDFKVNVSAGKNFREMKKLNL